MKREQGQIMDKICKEMYKHHCDAMILTTPYSVYYATGFAGSFLYKMHQAGLTIAVLTKEGKVTVIVSEFESQEARENCEDVEILTYPTFIYVDDYANSLRKKEEQQDLLYNFQIAMDVLQKETDIGTVGIEMRSIPFEIQKFFRQYRGKYCFVEADVVIREAKMKKTPWEIDVLRRGAEIDERVMRRVGSELFEGMTQAEIINRYKRYCFEADSEVIEVNQFHTFGSKFSPCYVLSTKPVQTGDIVRLDGGPTISGYYSDIARNYPVEGKMTERQKVIYRALWKGYQTGISMLRPGVRMCDVFIATVQAVIKNGIPNYTRGHHGHAIGCGSSAEEYPFIGPNQTKTFEPGMVMCFEVPYYSSINHSFNIEDTFLITEDGAEFFTRTEPIL